MNCPHCGAIAHCRECDGRIPDREDPRQLELSFLTPLRDFNLDGRKAVSVKMVMHDHEHASVAGSSQKEHEHDHDHGALSAAELDLLGQINELTAGENRVAHFETTWIRRIRDFPNQVFAAIGETRRMMREKTIKRSVGGALNWHFENFRESARRQKRAS